MLKLEEFTTRVVKWTEILSKITEGQARQILSAPKEKRVEVAEWIAEKYEKTGEIPSAREIRRYVQDLLEAEEEPQKEEAAVDDRRPAVQSMAESTEAASAAPKPELRGHVGETVESEEKSVKVEPPTQSGAGGGEKEKNEAEKRGEARFCPLCGSRISEDVYESIMEKLKRLSEAERYPR